LRYLGVLQDLSLRKGWEQGDMWWDISQIWGDKKEGDTYSIRGSNTIKRAWEDILGKTPGSI